MLSLTVPRRSPIRGDGTAAPYGVGLDRNIVTASLKAVASGTTRATQKAAGK